MTDKELLELAAKAVGYEVAIAYQPDVPRGLYVRHEDKTSVWMPLIDDADAFRLAVKLGIDLEWRNDGRVAAYRHANANGNCFTALESTREDRYAAARRAILLVAAEIGRRTE
jgi:hypothetical protein